MIPANKNVCIILFILSIIPASHSLQDSQRGILFNFQKKILLAERYTNVQFVLPFPILDARINEYLQSMAKSLDGLWQTDSHLCQLNFTVKRDLNISLDWTLKQAQQELRRAREDLSNLTDEAQSLLNVDAKDDKLPREKRLAPVAFAAGAGLFGLGLSS